MHIQFDGQFPGDVLERLDDAAQSEEEE